MKQTVGGLSSDLLMDAHENTHSAHEQTQEQLTDFEKELYACIEEALKKYPDDFYVVVITKKERLMPNVLRNYFFSRYSCPTPDYDQIVYKYHSRQHVLEFIWVIPARDICNQLLIEAPFVHPDERELLSYVIDFREGILGKKSLSLNGELAH